MQGSDILITVGVIQSSHARQAVAVAAKFGMAYELVLENLCGTLNVEKHRYYRNSNLLLYQLGA